MALADDLHLVDGQLIVESQLRSPDGRQIWVAGSSEAASGLIRPGPLVSRIVWAARVRSRERALDLASWDELPLPRAALRIIETVLRELEPEGIAAFPSSQARRWIVGFSRDGRLVAVAKVGCVDDHALAREVAVLRLPPVSPQVRVPRLISDQRLDGYRAVVTEGLPNSYRPARDLSSAVAVSLALAESERGTHGDLTPWNMFRSRDLPALAVLDWESWSSAHRPYWDIIHFVVQAQLSRLDVRSPLLASQLRTARLPALNDYASTVGVPTRDIPGLVAQYLDETENQEFGARARRVRQRVRTKFAAHGGARHT